MRFRPLTIQQFLVVFTILLLISAKMIFSKHTQSWFERDFTEYQFRNASNLLQFFQRKRFSKKKGFVLALFGIGLFGATYGWREQKGPLSKTCHKYPAMMKLCSYILAREDPKNLWIMLHTLWVLLASFFQWKSANFNIKKCRYRLHCF